MNETPPARCVIVGASHAGAQTALRLRRFGWSGPITLLGEEAAAPYHRPPLTKDYLKGSKTRERIALSPPSAYENAGITLELARRVTAIDTLARQVELEGGGRIGYDRLVLATGARARTLAVAGAELAGVYCLRTIADVDAIREALRPQAHAVVVGGGYIGLEAAASLRGLGLRVSVVEAESRVLSRVTCPVVSAFFERLHREEGVDVRTGARVEAFEGPGVLRRVCLDDGRRLDADLALIGIGIEPNVALAEGAGLEVDDGICVDEHCRTSDPRIFAAGDCTRFEHPRYRGRLRLESVQNANDQATTVAKALCGDPAAYAALPWFWSDQYDVKLQIAGLAGDHDARVVRGDPQNGRSFCVVYLRDGRIASVDAINRAQDFVQGRMLIDSDARMDPGRLADADLALKDCAIG